MLLSLALFSLAGFLFKGWGSSLTFCFYLKKYTKKSEKAMCCMCVGYKKHDRRKQQKGWLWGEAKKTGGVW